MKLVNTSVKRIQSRWSARQLSVLFTIIAIALWSYSITQAELNIGFFGLIHSLPISFFVALAFLAFASAILWVSPKNHGKLLFLQLCMLITALWVTPVLIGGSLPYHAGNYDLWRWFTEPILQQGHIYPEAIWYHAWPGSWILYASGATILGIDIFPDSLFAVYPFLFQFLLLLPLYLFLRNTISETRRNYCWAAAWLFYLGNWVGQSIMNAQAPAFFLLLTMLALFTSPDWESGAKALPYRLILIILLAALTITHMLTALATLFIIVALFAVKRIKGATLPVLAAIFIASWMIYEATVFFNANLPYFIQHILRLDLLIILGVTERISGSTSHEAVVKIRILTTLVFLAIAFAGYLLSRKVKRGANADRIVLAIGGAILILGIAISAGYGFESPTRFLLLLLPIVAYFGVKLLNLRITTIILCLLLVLAIPLHIVSHYGNQAMDYVPPAYVASSQFIQQRTAPGDITGRVHPWFGGHLKGYNKISFDELQWENDKLIYPNEVEENRPHYITIGRYDEREHDFWHNKPQFIKEIQNSLNNSTNCNLIYVNSEQRLYIHEINKK